jgi:hypothetical protein
MIRWSPVVCGSARIKRSSRVRDPSGVGNPPRVSRATRVLGTVDADARNALLTGAAALGGKQGRGIAEKQRRHGQRKGTKLKFH